MDPEIKELLWRLGWTPAEAAQECGVSLRTWRRWERCAPRMPHTALRLLRALSGLDLGEMHAAWQGWTITRRGELCTPENDIFGPGDVRALQYLYPLRDELQRVTKKLRADNEGQQNEIEQLKEERDLLRLRLDSSHHSRNYFFGRAANDVTAKPQLDDIPELKVLSLGQIGRRPTEPARDD